MNIKRIGKLSVFSCIVLLLIGLFSMQVYAEDLGTWTLKAPTPTGFTIVSATSLNNKIYAMGVYGTNSSGTSGLFKNYVYDPTKDTWSEIAPMTTSRQNMRVEAVNDKIYAMGGYDGSSNKFNIVQEYDPVKDIWAERAPMPTVRSDFASAVVNGKIYVFGGDPTSLNSNRVDEYNPETNTWATKAPMPTGRAAMGAAASNGKIYVIGGTNGNSTLNTVEEYDPQTDKWTSKTPMQTKRFGVSTTTLNGKIYAIGGVDGHGSAFNTVEEYDPQTDKWTTKAPLLVNGYYMGVATADNKIFAFGGSVVTTIRNANEAFTPTSQSAPINLKATANTSSISLTWDTVTGATGYNVKRSTTSGGPYDTIVASNINVTSCEDKNATTGVTYYYIVTAITSNGESAPSNEASATITVNSNRALLTITMTNGVEKEYDLSMNEVNAFIDWYNAKAAGTGPATYVMNKTYNKGPFLSRKDYIVFDKISDFEVNEYTPSSK